MPITYEGGREFLAGRWTHFSVHGAAPALESNEIRTVARQSRVMSNTGRIWQPDSDLTFTLPVDHEDIVAIGAWDDSGVGNFLGYVVLAEPVVFSDTNSRTLEVPASLLQLQVEDSAEVTNAGVALLYGLTERGPSDNLYASLHQSALVGGELGLGAELQTADSPGYARRALALNLAGSLTRAVNAFGIQWTATGTWTVEPAYIGIYDALTGGNLLYSFRQNFPALSGGTFTINTGDLELNMQRGLSMAADVVSPSASPTQDEIEDFALTTVPGAEVPARRLRGTTLVGLIEALTAGDRLDYESLKNQADLSLFFDGARISGTSLILIREDGQELRLQLPSSDVMADGVVTAAEVDVNTKRVTLTTSTGDTVAFDLSPFLLAVDQRFTEALATKLEGIAEGAQVNESIDMLFDDARIENNVLILTRVNDADIRLDLGDDTDLTGFFNNARVVNNNIIFTRQGRPDLLVALPAQQGGGIATVETNNYITGSGTVADPVELDDDALFRDWIGGTDAAVAASGPYEGTASADPGNYNWRDVTGASGTLWSGNRAALPRRFQGSAAFLTTQLSGAGAIAFRLQIRDQSNAVLGNLKFNDTSNDTRTFDVEVPIGTTSISGRLQVQGAGRYTANWRVTNVRFHLGDGILKDEIQAEIHAGTEHLTDNAFVGADFESFNRNLTLHRDGGENQVVNIPEADVSDFFDTAEIDGGVLRLTREDNTIVNLTLPTSTAVADGVVVSATLNPATKIVTITTSTGATVALNLASLALAADFGDVFENVQVIGNQLRFERFANADETVDLNNFPDNVVGASINGGVLTLTQFDGTTIDINLPAAEGGLSTVATENYVLGDGSDADKVRLDDTTLLRDWIGDYDTPITGSSSGGGTAAAAPGNYAWRNVGNAHTVVGSSQHEDNRRLQGDAALRVTRIVGAGAVGYRVVFDDNAGTTLGVLKFADTGEDTQRFDIPTGTGTFVRGRLQVQGAGEYSAGVIYSNRRFHDGDGVLKDEIQAEIQAGTEHLTDNAFSQVEFNETSRDLTMTTEGGDEQTVNIPQRAEQDISDLFKDAEINGGVLRLTREDDTAVNLTLPTGTAVADGVIISASLNQTTKIVTIRTSEGDSVILNLNQLVALRELETWARVSNTSLVPDDKIDPAIARTSALPRTGQLVPAGGTGGQVLGKSSATDYDTTWVDAGEGGSSGGGNTTHFVGQGNFDVTSPNQFALEANSADITLDDSDWFLFNIGAITTGANIDGHWAWIRGDDWRGLSPSIYGGFVAETNSRTVLSASNLSNAYRIGRTTDNKVLLASSSAGRDATPLTIRGVNEATPPTFLSLPETPNTPGSPGQSLIWNPAGDALVNADRGEAGVVTLGTGVSDLPIGPVRQVTRGTVPDDTVSIPNATSFVLPLATSGRTLHESLTVASDNNSIRVVNAGSYYIKADMEASASTLTNRHVALEGNGVLRAEGTVDVRINNEVISRGILSYARYGGWQVDGINGDLIVAEAGDVISVVTQVRRIDSSVGSLEWTGSICLKHQYVTGNALPGAGIESETINNIVTLTQAQYDAIASPDGGTYYIISG